MELLERRVASRSRRAAFAVALAVCLLAGVGWAPAALGAPGTLWLESRGLYQPPTKRPAKKVPELILTNQVPREFDANASSSVVIQCLTYAARDSQLNPLAGVKGRWEMWLLVLDHPIGTFERTTVGKGTFATNEHGLGFIRVEIPTTLFADGFASGETSAFSSTRVKFTNRKKVASADANCYLVIDG